MGKHSKPGGCMAILPLLPFMILAAGLRQAKAARKARKAR